MEKVGYGKWAIWMAITVLLSLLADNVIAQPGDLRLHTSTLLPAISVSFRFELSLNVLFFKDASLIWCSYYSLVDKMFLCIN